MFGSAEEQQKLEREVVWLKERLDGERRTAQAQRAADLRELAGAQARGAELASERDRLRAELATERGRGDEYLTRAVSATERFAELERRCAELERRCAASESAARTREEELAAARRSLAEERALGATLKAERDEALRRCVSLSSELAAAHASLKAAEARGDDAAAAARARAEELEAALAASLERVAKLESAAAERADQKTDALRSKTEVHLETLREKLGVKAASPTSTEVKLEEPSEERPAAPSTQSTEPAAEPTAPPTFDEDAAKKAAKKLKVAELRAALEAAGADTEGLKAALVERLVEVQRAAAGATARAPERAAGADAAGDVDVAPAPAPVSTPLSKSARKRRRKKLLQRQLRASAQDRTLKGLASMLYEAVDAEEILRGNIKDLQRDLDSDVSLRELYERAYRPESTLKLSLKEKKAVRAFQVKRLAHGAMAVLRAEVDRCAEARRENDA